MEPLETLPPPPQSDDAPFTPVSRTRPRTPLGEVVDELSQLTPYELADVHRYARRVRASRGDRPSPELVSRILAVIERFQIDYPERMPISLIRAGFPSVPRQLVDLALFEAEERHLLRLVPSHLPEAFVEVGAGIPHERGLLYWIVPA